ncbi:MAG: hypothetical protein MOB07_04115 [Acidobacteria bacterium]|nr:hypothetical protein [Acidobacteriota bacterium]
MPAMALAVNQQSGVPSRKTIVSIQGDRFFINGHPTYEGRAYRGMKIEGLLMNSRMVQGIFDDLNPETRSRWNYPDTGRWDSERNTREFIAALPEWRRHGLLGFTINFQGGSPQGYSQDQPWHNSAFDADGTLRKDYLSRMERILDKADELGMVAIVGYFYFGQDQRLRDEQAVRRGVVEATNWLLRHGYRNLLIEIANECDNRKYDQAIIKKDRIHELINLAKSITQNGRRLLVGASFNGGIIPSSNVVDVSDFLLLHGNGVKDPGRIAEMVEQTRKVPGYRSMPILFNEDDHFDFDQPVNNMLKAISAYASWGYFDPGQSDYKDGYQCPPVNWGINTERKKAFFNLVKEVTGA